MKEKSKDIDSLMQQELFFLIENYLSENADYDKESNSYDLELWIPQIFIVKLMEYIDTKYQLNKSFEGNYFDQIQKQFEKYDENLKDNPEWPFIYSVKALLDFINNSYGEFTALKIADETEVLFYPVYPEGKVSLVDDLITFEVTPGTMLHHISGNDQHFYSGVYQYYSGDINSKKQSDICEEFLLHTHYKDVTTTIREISKTETEELIRKLQSSENPNRQTKTAAENEQAVSELFRVMGDNSRYYTTVHNFDNPWEDDDGAGYMVQDDYPCSGVESVLLFCINDKYIAYLETTFNFWVES